MPAHNNSVITLTPVNLSSLNASGTSYTGITMMLLGDSIFNLSGSSGWQVVDRPKQVAATQWFDRSPYQLQFEGLIDGDYGNEYVSGALWPGNYGNGKPFWVKGYNINTRDFVSGELGGSLDLSYRAVGDWLFGSNNSVEATCAQLKQWLNPVPGTHQPPVLTISGPVDGTDKIWVLYNFEFTEALRDETTGNRFQQKVKIVLYEYVPPISTQVGYYNLTPAQIYALNPPPTPSGDPPVASKKYVIAKGDTFAKILAKLYPHSTVKATVRQNQFLALNPTGFSFSKLNSGKMIGKTIKVPVH